MTDMTFEAGALSSLLPHLDSESTFNQRTTQSLHRRRLPPEAYYEGTAGVSTSVQQSMLCRRQLLMRGGKVVWPSALRVMHARLHRLLLHTAQRSVACMRDLVCFWWQWTSGGPTRCRRSGARPRSGLRCPSSGASRWLREVSTPCS